MLDTRALQQLVQQQIETEVAAKIADILTEDWLQTVEQRAVQFVQDRIVGKFANSEVLPELIEAVKSSVQDLFATGQIPGLGQYVDHDLIKQNIDTRTQQLIETTINELTQDQVWLEKIEQLIVQQVTRKTTSLLSAVDLNPIVKQYIETVRVKLLPGIQDQSTGVELTVMDDNVVVENNFTARDISAVNSITVKDLVVKGSINTDNHSWNALAQSISQKTLDQLTTEWRQTLVDQVTAQISQQGIAFDNIKIGTEPLLKDGQLSPAIAQSNLRQVGTLTGLTVAGDVDLNSTVTVSKKRLGVNTQEPEMALSVWDEEVALIAGKHKAKVGYLGTARKQGLAIGINKVPAIEIDEEGLTAVKKLQVGVHRISHGTEVPNYSGTRGDVVFNASPTVDNPVFAWQCLGGFKWKVIRAVQ